MTKVEKLAAEKAAAESQVSNTNETIDLSEMSVDEIRTKLTELGVSSKKLDGAFGSTYLPATFTPTKILCKQSDIDGNHVAYVVLSDGINEISLSRLTALILPIDAPIVVAPIEKGQYVGVRYLKNTINVNPQFAGDQSVIASRMLGVTYTTKKVEGKAIKFGCKTDATALASVKPIFTYELIEA